jgi:hypothetical protein
MSKFPTPQRALDGPKEAFDCVLEHIIATQPANREAKIKPHLLNFISHPIIKELIGCSDDPPAQTDSNNLELARIQETLVQLSKAVDTLKKDNTTPSEKANPRSKQKASATSKPAPRTHSAAAGSRPSNPSLVVDLAHLGVSTGNRVKLETICCALNDGLGRISLPQIQLAAVRWTAKGNLVVTGGPSSSPQSLQTATPHISAILTLALKLPSTSLISQPRANVKWSKILINGVPTGATKEREPYSPDECHTALAAINPAYAQLTITQKPSWVCHPTSYQPGTASSLTVAFEDPDGAKLKTLLADKYLFLFGNRVAVKKWKQRRKVNKETACDNAIEHTSDGDLLDEEDVKNTLQPSDTPSFSFANSPAPPSTIWFTPGGDSNHPNAGNLFGRQLLEHGKINKAHPLERNRSRTPTERSKLANYSPPRTRSSNNPSSRAKGKQRA